MGLFTGYVLRINKLEAALAEARAQIAARDMALDNLAGRVKVAEASARYARVQELVAQIAAKDAALRQIADAPAWGAPDKWETTPAEVRQLAREALAAPARETE